MNSEKTYTLAEEISNSFSSIYFHCHPTFTMNLTHQSIRALQFINFLGISTVYDVAVQLQCAPNTASEMLRRLVSKNLLRRQRRKEDERVVELQLTDIGKHILLQHTGLDVDKLDNLLKYLTSDEKEIVKHGFQLLEQAARRTT